MVNWGKRDYKYYVENEAIKKILKEEFEVYVTFLEEAHKDNLQTAKDNQIKHPRWSIISGYFAMHDVSKLFLAQKYNLKFSSFEVHNAVIEALKEVLKGDLKNKIINLIKIGEKRFQEISNLPYALKRGKIERSNVQYYKDLSSRTKVDLFRTAYFLEKIVVPYIEIMQRLIKND